MGEETRTESGQRRRTWVGDGEGMVGKKRHHPSGAGANAQPFASAPGCAPAYRTAHAWRARACPCEITRLVPPGTGNETCPALTLFPFSRSNTGQLSIPVCATSTVPSRVHYAKRRDRPEQTSNPLRRQNCRCPMRVPAAAAVAVPGTAPSGALRGWRGQSCPQGRRRRAEPRLRCLTRPGNSRAPRTPKEQRPGKERRQSRGWKTLESPGGAGTSSARSGAGGDKDVTGSLENTHQD